MNKQLLKLTLPAVALMLAGSAFAVPTLTISDNNGHTTGALPLVGGILTFNGPLGSWNINIVTAETQPTIGSAVAADMDLDWNDTFSGVAGVGNVLTISFSADGFAAGTKGVNADLGGTQTGGGGGSVLFTTSAGTSFSTSTTPFSNSQSGVVNIVDGTTSLTMGIQLTANGPGYHTSGDSELAAVPDSGTTLVLLGSSLTVLGLFARSRKVVA